MPLHPIANNRSKFADLEVETLIVPRRNTKRIFIEPNLGAVIARVKPAVQSRLPEKIDVRYKLRVKKDRQSRIEEIVDLAVNEAGRRLFEMISFDVEPAA